MRLPNELGDIYSTSEKRIGTWIDGKPIYRKVISQTTLFPAGDTTINHGISNLETVVSARLESDSTYKFPYMTANSKFALLDQVNPTNVLIRNNTGEDFFSKPAMLYIILEYTKTPTP